MVGSHCRWRSRRRSIVISLLVCWSIGRLLSPLRRCSLGSALRTIIDGWSCRIGVVDWGRHGHVVLHVVVIGAVIVIAGLRVRIARVDTGELRSADKPSVVCQRRQPLSHSLLCVGVSKDEIQTEQGEQPQKYGPLYDVASFRIPERRAPSLIITHPTIGNMCRSRSRRCQSSSRLLPERQHRCRHYYDVSRGRRRRSTTRAVKGEKDAW